MRMCIRPGSLVMTYSRQQGLEAGGAEGTPRNLESGDLLLRSSCALPA